MIETQTFIGELVVENCCECGVTFAMTRDLYNRRRNDHKGFFCPNGHQQYYSSKSEAEKLREQLKEKDQSLDYYRTANNNLHNRITEKNHEIRAHKAAKTRLKNRVKHGVCPCCNRTFKQLAEHMKQMHPEYVNENKG